MKTRFAALAAAVTLATLGACAKQERVREIDWAKAALARNPAFEILATDESTGAFTVRDTATGGVRTLRLEDLIAAPLPERTLARTIASSAANTAAPPPAPIAMAPAPVEPAVRAAPADDQTTGIVVATGGKRASVSADSVKPGTVAPASNVTATLEGPGYTITHDEPTKGTGKANAEAIAANVERRTDPIICQGDPLMRIDGETIESTGDALIVEKGCDLYISNTNIRAGGVGIIARQARVHIVNSTIDGTRGSYEASEGAEIYVARSTFTGVGRRFDAATMNDLGGNTYQTH